MSSPQRLVPFFFINPQGCTSPTHYSRRRVLELFRASLVNPKSAIRFDDRHGNNPSRLDQRRELDTPLPCRCLDQYLLPCHRLLHRRGSHHSTPASFSKPARHFLHQLDPSELPWLGHRKHGVCSEWQLAHQSWRLRGGIRCKSALRSILVHSYKMTTQQTTYRSLRSECTTPGAVLDGCLATFAAFTRYVLAVLAKGTRCEFGHERCSCTPVYDYHSRSPFAPINSGHASF